MLQCQNPLLKHWRNIGKTLVKNFWNTCENFSNMSSPSSETFSSMSLASSETFSNMSSQSSETFSSMSIALPETFSNMSLPSSETFSSMSLASGYLVVGGEHVTCLHPTQVLRVLKVLVGFWCELSEVYLYHALNYQNLGIRMPFWNIWVLCELTRGYLNLKGPYQQIKLFDIWNRWVSWVLW